MIKYIGSKRALVNHILSAIDDQLPQGGVVCDLFSGTSRIGHALKGEGFGVWSNDHNAYAHTLATAYVQANRTRWLDPAEKLLDELSTVPPHHGWFTEDYCEKARYFTPKNGARIEGIRNRIQELNVDQELKAILLVSLMEAADRVDSTAGIQMAYMKTWAPRALNDLKLRMPDVLPTVPGSPCRATQADALEIAPDIKADLVYLDPPYNQHSYLGNYHVWETLVRWDRPETYGIANKRVDVRTRKSPFNFRHGTAPAMRTLIDRLQSPNLIVSFNDEGFLSREDLVGMLSTRGPVTVLEVERPRYVGARIGIHNLKGEKVGVVGRLRNIEQLFIVGERAALATARLRDAA